MSQIVTRDFPFLIKSKYSDPDYKSVWIYHRWLLAGPPSR